MPKALKYGLGFLGVIYILRNPNAAADTVTNVVNAILSIMDGTAKSKT